MLRTEQHRTPLERSKQNSSGWESESKAMANDSHLIPYDSAKNRKTKLSPPPERRIVGDENRERIK